MSNFAISSRRPLVSPLRYPGGKTALYSRLRDILRRAGLLGGTYVEPYAGGAGAGLALLLTGQVERIVINDLDPAIFEFWKAVVHDTDRFIARVQDVELSVDEWRRQKVVHQQGTLADGFDLGFSTFYLNRTNRSGVLNGGPIGGLDQTGNYKIDARFNRVGLIDRVRMIGRYSSKIHVASADGRQIIEDYSKCNDAFIYADPPYFEKAGSLYMNSFTMNDHNLLAETLNRNRFSNWVLTYDDVQHVDDLYSDRRRFRFSLNYSAHRVIKATEVAVISDRLPELDWH